MKIIKFLGGLGNQMFQYAFYKSMQKRSPNIKADLHGYEHYTVHNGFELENIFGIKVNEVSSFTSKLFYIPNRKWIYRKLRRLLNIKNAYYEEKTLFSFDPAILNNPRKTYYWGYWQNHQYFAAIADEIKADFTFKNPLTPENQQVMAEINQSNSISIHIRRGDYLKEPLFGGLCSPGYYQQAIDYIKARVTTPTFFVFSDDIPWCLENLNLADSTFISWNKASSSYVDMQLMSACKHNIIANSSFSWWAAWLNQYPGKFVICPKRWINHNDPNVNMSYPNEWVSI